jgi:hypothetical protein
MVYSGDLYPLSSHTVFNRAQVTQCGMNTFSVVENLDVFEYILLDFHCTIIPPMNTLLFCCKKALDAGVVIRTSEPAHAGSDVVLLKDFSKAEAA